MELWLRHAQEMGQTRKIQLKYFYVTFYKKGTCHVEFTNEDFLKKLNIIGSQQKKWLPPGYGKKAYHEMPPEEKAVIVEIKDAGADSLEKAVDCVRDVSYSAQEIVLDADYLTPDYTTGKPASFYAADWIDLDEVQEMDADFTL